MKSTAIILFLLFFSAMAGAQTGTGYNGASWSRDGKWIAFSKMLFDQSVKPPKMTADVYIVRSDGSELRKVTGDAANEFNPVFSHDGHRLLYNASDPVKRTANIFSSDLSGADLRQLTSDVDHASAAEISPDGKWIVFNGTLTADPSDHIVQIYVSRVDGTQVKRLTSDPKVSSYNPVWSPDGKRLVYYLERGDKKDQIWTMNADGSDARLLTANIGHNFYPSWSPDGRHILFTSVRDDKPRQLYTMNADGSDVKPVGINGFFGRYSPDGKRIVYIGGEFPQMTLMVANSDGSSPVKLVP